MDLIFTVSAVHMLFQLTSVDLCIPFGWQLAHNKRLCLGLKGQLASGELVIRHICNAIVEHNYPLWNWLSYEAAM